MLQGERPAEPQLQLHTTPADFGAGRCRGVRLTGEGPAARLVLDARRLRPHHDGGGRAWRGVYVSPIWTAPAFDQLIISWNADTPPGTWLRIDARAGRASARRWTRWYALALWSADNATLQRRSLPDQRDRHGAVATDTLLLAAGGYTRYQYRLTLWTNDPASTPAVRRIAVLTDDSRVPPGAAPQPAGLAWGRDLPVPPRSQMPYPQGHGWCSPTSTAMVLAYWGHHVPVPEAAAATFDHTYGGTGNWSFNTAWAATFGLCAYVTRLRSLADLEAWIAARVPVIISIAVRDGELPGAPYRHSDGHLLVVRGFTTEGDVIANDPAFPDDAAVRVVYPRTALERAWLGHSRGTCYLIYPADHPPPAAPR
ncbi:peptidase C39 family protein [Kallotenue papyrolyticum]|uniref:peptidase C39 family protein n=1 Tax=Kallotenue papyrolyticum TaxID=1325125 RepID=UPI0013777FA1|nr:peptidase C39 family protein [Kallotenue papyrolyticum]